MKTASDQGLLAIVFIAALGTTLLFWALLPARFRVNEMTDYWHFYEPVARNMLAGRGIVGMEGSLATRYPPGFPLLLAGVFGLADLVHLPEPLALSAFILVCTALTAVWIFWLARGLWGARPALVVALAWISYPGALWLTKQPNSEIPFMAVFYGGFCLFWYAFQRHRSGWVLFFLAGFLVGFAMLIRPIAIGGLFLMAGLLGGLAQERAWGHRLGRVVAVVLGGLLAVLPWEWWMYRHTGSVILLGTVGGSPNLVHGLTFAVDPLKQYRQVPFVPQDVKALMQDLYGRLQGAQSLREILPVVVQEFGGRPLAMVKLFAFKAAHSWYGTDSGRFEFLNILIQIPYLAVVLWSSLKAWRRGGHARQFMICAGTFVLYAWAMSVVGHSMLRYLVPYFGLLLVSIGVNWAQVERWDGRRPRPSRSVKT